MSNFLQKLKDSKYGGTKMGQSEIPTHLLQGMLGAMMGSSLGNMMNPMGSIPQDWNPGNFYAGGGRGQGEVAEVEGGEVIERGSGRQLEQIKGPSHGKGGVDTFLEPDDIVYSKRIKRQGKTMAKRKLSRDSKLKKMKAALNRDTRSLKGVNQDSYERLKREMQLEDMEDQQYQQMTTMLKEYDDDDSSYSTSQAPSGDKPKYYDGRSADDLGNFGTIFNAFAPLANTLSNSRHDTPNLNSFANVNSDAIATADLDIDGLQFNRKSLDQDLLGIKNASDKVAETSSRSLNTLNALKTVNDTKFIDGKIKNRGQYMDRLSQSLKVKENLQRESSIYDARGEQGRDMADRQQLDNRNTQLGSDFSNLGLGIQNLSKQKNVQYAQKEMASLFEKYQGGQITKEQFMNAMRMYQIALKIPMEAPKK